MVPSVDYDPLDTPRRLAKTHDYRLLNLLDYGTVPVLDAHGLPHCLSLHTRYNPAAAEHMQGSFGELGAALAGAVEK